MIARREFISLVGGATAAWPLAARAQQTGKLPTIGFLGAATPVGWSNYVAAFLQRLHELGWEEGRTVAIEYRWADGRPERYAEIAAEFVRLKVDVIVTSGTAAGAVKLVTSAVPIVFAVAVDPVGAGLVVSLAMPGGNATGLSSQTGDLGGKRLELLREVVPGLRRLAILGNTSYRAVVQEMSEVAAAARTFGMEVVQLEMHRANEIAPAVAALKDKADALYVCTESFAAANRVRIVVSALGARLPTIYGERAHVDAGGFMSYGANVPALFRRAGDHVDKILRGAKPANIPVEQATQFELVINLTTAKALGLDMPPMLLARADEVIE